MFCNNCGKEIKEGAKFCNYCGAAQIVEIAHNTAVEANPANETNVIQPKIRRNKAMIIFGVIILIATAIVCYFTFQEYDYARSSYEYYSSHPVLNMFSPMYEQNLSSVRYYEEDMNLFKTLTIAIGSGGGFLGILFICLGSVKKSRY